VTGLIDIIAPCGPIADPRAADRAKARLDAPARDGGWDGVFDRAWPALAPVFGASPYLASLAFRDPDRLRRVLIDPPTERLATLVAGLSAVAAAETTEKAEGILRDRKAELHLLTALADLGGAWRLDEVTHALTRYADASVEAAMILATREAVEAGRLSPVAPGGAAAGLFGVAMGKQGAFELNYSSDIDISFFYEPDLFAVTAPHEAQPVARRLVERVGEILQGRTADGYVFRVDMRLRPDPSSTSPAVPVPLALNYYQSVGQNWERAAFIKARAVGGDTALGEAFLDELQPFIWRRNLDFAAIADIHSIKRQIHIHKVDDRLTAKGADLKLGRGGIREIEFFVQTQQLILGGRQSSLRSPRTLDALDALAAAGHVETQTAREMADAYRDLRALEHRCQMLADEQTHVLPESDAERRRVAALSGFEPLRAFDARVGRTLKLVNRRYGELFAGEEPLSSRFGSLVFTGVEDDRETLATLRRMGFLDPPRISATVRAWHHGRIGATRTERGREAFTRLAPRLLEAVSATGAPDDAFARFADFFVGLTLGVQVQSLFLAQPRLLELLVRVMAYAPRMANSLSRRPATLDALMDASFFEPIDGADRVRDDILAANGFEAAMDEARRRRAEGAFRIGVQVFAGVADADAAGRAFADLADAIIQGLSSVALDEVSRIGGAFDGDVAVIALGKCGSREMSAKSDLDLMTLYRPRAPGAESMIKGWDAQTFYARFTQRLVAALSAPTTAGELYEVDMRLRPSGTAGPVAVSRDAFDGYYAGEAETWEFLSLTRARVVWASRDAFAAETTAAIEAVLRRPRDPKICAHDVREMRTLMTAERPAKGFWDLKLSDGGLVDIEFIAQHLQLIGAASGGPLHANTGAALEALIAAGDSNARALIGVLDAWRLNQGLAQWMKIALDDEGALEAEPDAFKSLLAKAGGARTFLTLQTKLTKARATVRAAWDKLIVV